MIGARHTPWISPGGWALPHRWRSLALGLLGTVVVFLLMAQDRHLPWGSAVGLVALVVSIVGILGWLGVLQPSSDPPTISARPDWWRWALYTLGAGSCTCLVARGAVAGHLDRAGLVATIAIPSGMILCLGLGYRTVELLAPGANQGKVPRWPWSHPSFWLLGLTILAYAPRLGSYALIDPWETHYGEVAREVLARDDWISLWWAQDGWFWSKPVLDFWVQALSFSLLGVDFIPDRMLLGVTQGRWVAPEWAARLPILIMGLFGQGLMYAGLVKAWGRRAAFVGCLLWMATPLWVLLTHQSMTDLPYVAMLSAAFGLFLLGFATPPQTIAPECVIAFRGHFWAVSMRALVLGSILALSLPQLLYLASRNLTLVTHGKDLGFWWHADRFFMGSGGGNCGIPGNMRCTLAESARHQPQPLLLALVLGLALGLLLWRRRREHHLQPFYFLGGWLLLMLSGLAKGLPGLLIALATLMAFLLATRRYSDLVRLDWLGACLLAFTVLLPWFIQMTLRHGMPFLDRLFIHDMYKRAFVHVHDTNGNDDVSLGYYIWQLGYGLFPLAGPCAAGLLFWQNRPNLQRNLGQQASTLLFFWFLASFGLFSLTLTKFHHYILPAVPPLALLAGVVVTRSLGQWRWPKGWLGLAWAALALVLAFLALDLARRCLHSPWQGVSGTLPPQETWSWSRLGLPGALEILGLLLGFGFWLRQPSPVPNLWTRPHRKLLVALGLLSATTVALVGRDWLSATSAGPPGDVRLLHLICYSYSRSWPASLNLARMLSAFTWTASLTFLALSLVPRYRAQLGGTLAALLLIWAYWVGNVYLPVLAPHWSQKNTVAEYYRHRKGPHENLVAYQMNWKGENFYTGNRVFAFVSTGERFKTFLENRKRTGQSVLFFTLEHGRISGLRSELGQVRQFQVLTNRSFNDKFALVRVELD